MAISERTAPNKIQQNFSDSAKGYDLHSNLHQAIADKLLAQLKNKQAASILDSGCGTGNLTIKLKEQFPQAKIIGLDFAQGMIDRARQKNEALTWVLGDSHQLPFADSNFDLVVSNLAYQWAQDLTQAFREARRVIVDEGNFCCTIFGFHTCQELFQSFGEISSGRVQFKRLPAQSQVEEALNVGGFQNPTIATELIKLEFKDMHALLAWLKSIGANNLLREGFIGREGISKAALAYQEKFSFKQGVAATFEVIYIDAKK